MFLFVVLCFPVALLPVEDLANRLALTLTLLLAAVGADDALRSTLPAVSYLTLLDKYGLLCKVSVWGGGGRGGRRVGC